MLFSPWDLLNFLTSSHNVILHYGVFHICMPRLCDILLFWINVQGNAFFPCSCTGTAYDPACTSVLSISIFDVFFLEEGQWTSWG